MLSLAAALARHPLDYTLSFAGITAQAVVLARIHQRKLVRQWPSITCILWLAVLSNLYMIPIMENRSRYREYFYIYWLTAGISALLRFWLLFDIARSFTGLRFIPVKFQAWTAGISGFVAVSVACISFRGHPPLAKGIHLIVLYSSNASLGWMAFFAVLIAIYSVPRITWGMLSVRITQGFILQLIGSALGGVLLTYSKTFSTPFYLLDSLCSIACYIIWLFAFSSRAAALENY